MLSCEYVWMMNTGSIVIEQRHALNRDVSIDIYICINYKMIFNPVK